MKFSAPFYDEINKGELYCPFCKKKLCSTPIEHLVNPKIVGGDPEELSSYAFCRFCYQEYRIVVIRTNAFKYFNIDLSALSPDFGDDFEFDGDNYPEVEEEIQTVKVTLNKKSADELPAQSTHNEGYESRNEYTKQI